MSGELYVDDIIFGGFTPRYHYVNIFLHIIIMSSIFVRNLSSRAHGSSMFHVPRCSVGLSVLSRWALLRSRYFDMGSKSIGGEYLRTTGLIVPSCSCRWIHHSTSINWLVTKPVRPSTCHQIHYVDSALMQRDLPYDLFTCSVHVY